MKRNFLFGVITVAAVLVLFTGSNVLAVDNWHECKVLQSGIDESGAVTLKLLRLKNNTTRVCDTPAVISKSVLAIALTAMSNGVTVQVFCDWALANPVIKEFHMNDTAAP